MNNIDTSVFYNPNKLFSFNALYSFCMGDRGCGKTYAGKKKMIKDWLYKGKQSVYLRRTVKELEMVKDNIFEDIAPEFQGHEITVKGFQGFIDGECFCYFMALSIAPQYKSASFPLVDFIFFDEYVVTKTRNNGYLKNEMILLHDLVSTVFRHRDPFVYLCSNAVSYVNPFFEFYKIEPKPKEQFIKHKDNYGDIDVVVELTGASAYREMVKRSRFARMLEGTAYYDYAIENETLEDTNDFLVPKKPQGFDYCRCAFRIGNKVVGVWSRNVGDSGCYISEKYDPSCTKYTIYSNQNFEGYKSIKIDRNSWNISYIRTSFLNSKTWYESQAIKKMYIEEISKYI